MSKQKNDMLDDWLRYQDHFFTTCRYCHRGFGSNVSLSFMRYHLRQVHPEKIGWKPRGIK